MSQKSNGGMKWGAGIVALVLALAGCTAPSPANQQGSETLTATWTPALSTDAPTDANATVAVTATVQLTGTVATVETAVTIEPTETVTEEITSTTPVSDTQPITNTTPITDGATPGAAGAGLTFGAEADTQVREFEPSINFGSEPTLRADGGTDPLHESYLRFAVTGVEGPVARATLRLYAETGAAAGLSVYITWNEWDELELNWRNRPPRTEEALDVKQEEVRAQTWVEFDVTEAVTGDANYSFVIGIGESNGLAMTSKEGNPEMAPQLVIQVEE